MLEHLATSLYRIEGKPTYSVHLLGDGHDIPDLQTVFTMILLIINSNITGTNTHRKIYALSQNSSLERMLRTPTSITVKDWNHMTVKNL